jgi:hypothetical protein
MACLAEVAAARVRVNEGTGTIDALNSAWEDYVSSADALVELHQAAVDGLVIAARDAAVEAQVSSFDRKDFYWRALMLEAMVAVLADEC